MVNLIIGVCTVAINLSTNMAYVINMFGSSMTLKRKTSTINKYGDETATYTTETITAGVNDINDESGWDKYGIFNPGDKIFFIKSTVTKPSEGDEIVYNGSTYEIKKVQAPDSGTVSHYECGAKSI